MESISFAMPDIDNYWHSQTVIVLLGRRLPLHILMLCNEFRLMTKSSHCQLTGILFGYTLIDPTVIYNASVAVSRLKLSSWAEPFAGSI